MGSGRAGIASVHIENGQIGLAEVCGHFTPDQDKPVKLGITLEEQGEGVGNIHAPPRRRDVAVYLTYEELGALIAQLDEWRQ